MRIICIDGQCLKNYLSMVLNEKKKVIYQSLMSVENSDKGYILEVDVEYLKNLHKLHSDLPFLLERKKIKKM